MNTSFTLKVWVLALMCVGWVASANAEVLLKEGFDSNVSNLSAQPGFSSKYCKDGWTTALNDGVMATTDDGCECSSVGSSSCDYATYVVGTNKCYKSEPVDNILTMGKGTWTDYTFTVRFRNLDNDTLGVVFRYVNTANYYAVWFSRDIGPGTSAACDGSFPGARLVKVAAGGTGGGKAEVIAASTTTYTQGKVHLVRVRLKGSSIVVHFDANADGKLDEAKELLFNAQDSSHKAGGVGLYAYQNGASPGTSCAGGGCWFDDVLVVTDEGVIQAPDKDGDGVPDSKDNCPGVANPKQVNIDGDKLGDACDDDIDGDGLSNDLEKSLGLNPMDADTDDDGLRDGLEPKPSEDFDGDGRSNGTDPDSDGDGLPDGLEAGVAVAGPGTDLSAGYFRADEDPSSTTNPLSSDSDGDGLTDSQEDANRNGKIDSCESDPNVPDELPCAPAQPDAGSAPGVDTEGDSPDGLVASDGKSGPLALSVANGGDSSGCSATRRASSFPVFVLTLLMVACAVLARRKRST